MAEYPNPEMIKQWHYEWELAIKQAISSRVRLDCSSLEYVAYKACDWQRERDAEICKKVSKDYAEHGDMAYSFTAGYCADSIRGGSNEQG